MNLDSLSKFRKKPHDIDVFNNKNNSYWEALIIVNPGVENSKSCRTYHGDQHAVKQCTRIDLRTGALASH